ncbi:hypothetical protein [Vibrio mangrovi]|uniref:Uncharacterized protein n=1 Tax=Vibrio mangrovi TaxID=474394 RepID=A0A1Y6ISK1_9VIBR|nr:hypothetical protein [Vibrio mangrovi]MDW6001371.1 hypothetical protein [Vibrio mangrovi]SMS00606.1 hypothetical protein VIM7927_01872 [Vibrio mangrovi]
MLKASFLLIIPTLSFGGDYSLESRGNDLVVNNGHSSKIYENILNDYQNDMIFISSFLGSPVLERTSESISKDDIVFTFNSDYSKFDCAYFSYYSYYSHLLMGKSVCGLDKKISSENIENIIDILGSMKLDEGDSSTVLKAPIQQRIVEFGDIDVVVSASSIDDILMENFYILIKSGKNEKTISMDKYYIEYDKKGDPIFLSIYKNEAIKKYSYNELSYL